MRRFSWIRRLATDHAFAYEHVADFFSGNPARPDAWRDAIARAQHHPRDRERIAAVLEDQQRARGAPVEAVTAVSELRDPRAVTILTGQQAGLFGGPLYTLLKALTAVRLAEQVRAEHRVPAVAIFWVDAEDHDWDEVKRCAVLDAALAPQSVTLGSPPGAHTGPVGRVRLDADIDRALADLERVLPVTAFTGDLLATLRRAYRPGAGMAEAFSTWMESVLGPRGLVVFDASDAAAKPLAGPVFTREIERAGDTSWLAAEAGAALQARGYHAQATPQAGTVALFHLQHGREPIRQEGAGFAIGDASYTKAALIELAAQRPHEFSPNVLLRPIVQDTLFPTACYVAGPSELAYLAQLGAVYRAFGVPMPLVAHRASVTLVDSNAMRFLVKHDIPLEALRARDEGALNQLLASQLPPGIEGSLEDAGRLLQERLDALAAVVPQIDPTLEAATRATLGRMQDDLKKLHGKIIQAAKRKDDTLRRQFTHAQAQAFPGGHPQEREIGAVSFLNAYGTALVERLDEALTLETGIHWVIAV